VSHVETKCLLQASVEQLDRPKTPQERVFDAVRVAEEEQARKGSPVLERRTEIHLSSSSTHSSRSNSTQNLASSSQHAVVETPPVEVEVEVESTYVNVIPATSTPKVSESTPVEQRASPIPAPQSDLGSSTSNLNETPQRKRTLPARPTIAPKPSVSSRATSEPPSGLPPHMVLSGGEPTSLPHEAQQQQQSQDSPMPELLSLKDRLKLFEKEIDDQQKVPEPKKDRKFSFLSDDEVVKMKEEEAKRIASMTALDLEAFDSLTSHLSIEDDAQTVRTQVEELDRYDCTEASSNLQLSGGEKEETSEGLSEAEQKAAWRKARLDSLEEDTMQAQIVIEKMSELSTFETGMEGEDNANYRHPVDTQGNITGPRREEVEEEEMDEEVNSDSELTSSEETTTADIRFCFNLTTAI